MVLGRPPHPSEIVVDPLLLRRGQPPVCFFDQLATGTGDHELAPRAGQPRQRADYTRNSGWNMRINQCRPYGPRNICAERDIVGVFRHHPPTGSGTSLQTGPCRRCMATVGCQCAVDFLVYNMLRSQPVPTLRIGSLANTTRVPLRRFCGRPLSCAACRSSQCSG